MSDSDSGPSSDIMNICLIFDALTKHRGLTWNGDGKLFGLDGQKPAAQLIVAAVGWTDQSDGAFAVGRLVIQRHLLVGQDVVVV